MDTSTNRHFAVIDPVKKKITVKYEDQVIVESKEALLLKEVGRSIYDPVFYFPKSDLKVSLKLETKYQSHCPIKGDATYWTIPNAPDDTYFAWSYESALPRSKKIEKFIAFNADLVTIISEPV